MTTDGTPTKDTYRKAMKVTGVKIVGLPNSGKLIIASTDEKTYPSSSLLWNAKEANKTYEFSLKNTQDKVISSTNGVDLTGKYEDSKFAGDKVQIGDALMVKAGETKYTVEVTLEQWVLVNEDGKNNDPTAATNAVTTGWEKKTQTITGPISLEGIDGLTDKTFQAGTSYTVNITVYGYEKIDVNGHLVPWKEGSTIDIDIDSIDNTWTTTE